MRSVRHRLGTRTLRPAAAPHQRRSNHLSIEYIEGRYLPRNVPVTDLSDNTTDLTPLRRFRFVTEKAPT
jgi:hypothetical protein